jgi:superfamily II DNA or RNA helicase
MTRTERQSLMLERIISFKGKGYISACGSFGKTRTSLNFVKYVLNLRPKYGLTVIVPTIPLKEQWEIEIAKRDIANYIVKVINGVVISNEEINTEICIVDRLCPH